MLTTYYTFVCVVDVFDTLFRVPGDCNGSRCVKFKLQCNGQSLPPLLLFHHAASHETASRTEGASDEVDGCRLTASGRPGLARGAERVDAHGSAWSSRMAKSRLNKVNFSETSPYSLRASTSLHIDEYTCNS
jgi:hypothetical protein